MCYFSTEDLVITSYRYIRAFRLG
uniref:Uncharacterized protein n=1 Tax=Rhizophora mucronata TaxID=61149 RepID=A0A2P2PF90_RHIMU